MAKTAKTRTPKNLAEAMCAGWRIDETLSTWKLNGIYRREGFLFLKKPGAGRNSEQLIVPFTALYDASPAYFLSDKL